MLKRIPLNEAIALISSVLFSTMLCAQCDFTEVFVTSSTGGWGYEMSWILYDENDEEVGSFQGEEDNDTAEQTLCLEDGCYTLYANDTYGDGWNGGSVEFDIEGEIVFYEMTGGSDDAIAFGVNADGCVVVIPGCTDPEAINYNPVATVDDGSCTTIQGVLDEQSITLMLESGPKDNRINWAIQNRGMPNANDEFDSEEEFLQFFEDGLLQTFEPGNDIEKTPFGRYHNFFNLYAWWWPDAPQEGEGWSWPLLKGMRDLYFLPWADDEHGWATLFSTSKWGGGGGAGVQPETRTGDGLMFGMEWETLLHEFCHTMPQIPDEYTASGEWSGGQCWEGANTSGHIIRDSIPWRLWIDEETELPTPYVEDNLNTIGAFEGALTNYFGCHRPTARGCYMGAGGFGEGYGMDLCSPCVQRVIAHLYKYVDVIENPVPLDETVSVTGNETVLFSADIVKPEPNSQVYQWFLNGELIAEGTEEVEITFGDCDLYEVTLTVEDTTSWFRYDPGFDHIYPKPFESHTWVVDQTEVDDYDMAATPNPVPTNCTGGATGEVTFDIEGGSGTYTVLYEGQEVSNPHSDLLSGSYNYWVQDEEGCGVELSDVMVEEEILLTAEICADYLDGSWSLVAEASGYENVSFLWSTGATESSVSGLTNGEYNVEITTVDGCSITETVNLASQDEPLVVTHDYLPSSTESDDGRIDVYVDGGTEPYTIEWYDNPLGDLTFPDPVHIEVSGYNWDHLPEMAFDNDLDTKWLHWVSEDAWISFEFDEPTVITQYTMTSGDDVEERDPKDWVFEGSDDGNTWVLIDERVDQDFPERRQKKLFLTENSTAYTFYRFWVNENSGDDTIQLQELEFIGVDPTAEAVHNPNADGLFSRIDLAPGEYEYLVQDANMECGGAEVSIGAFETYSLEGMHVIQDGPCSVTIEEPQDGYDYYWLSSEEGESILHIGDYFSPPAAGNYWVGAVNQETMGMSANRPGFAVTMPGTPEVAEVEEGVLGIVNPDSELVYRWYTNQCGGDMIHEGETYTPGTEEEQYYIASWWAEPFPEVIDPTTVDGFLLRMDAADIDGDGEIDDPQPPTSSLYDWYFSPSNGLVNGGWFAYRSNYQNGLGIADFATMWLQCIDDGFSQYSSFVMAYKENALSWEGSAPFYNMHEEIPYSANPSEQLYADDAPISTLNGGTWLNGDEVDPLNTPNPMDFCILGQNFTEPAGWVDCSHTHWEGMIGEIIFFDDPISNEDMIGVSEFLRKKWISTADLESVRNCIVWDGQGIGVDENSDSNFSVYPNPVNAISVVSLRGLEDPSILSLISADGAILEQMNVPSGTSFVSLSGWISDRAPGVYIVTVRLKSGKVLFQRIAKP